MKISGMATFIQKIKIRHVGCHDSKSLAMHFIRRGMRLQADIIYRHHRVRTVLTVGVRTQNFSVIILSKKSGVLVGQLEVGTILYVKYKN